jgi:hypothetical protein
VETWSGRNTAWKQSHPLNADVMLQPQCKPERPSQLRHIFQSIHDAFHCRSLPLITSTYNPIQMILITTSNPLFSPPSYLKLHIPSVFSFQYAPVALCRPLLPGCGFESVLVCASEDPTTSLLTSAGSVPVEVDVEAVGARGLCRAEVGTRCWIMVLLTAYL